ncbi:MAG: PKD domain-containing protein [Dehalococcoidia bacterium]
MRAIVLSVLILMLVTSGTLVASQPAQAMDWGPKTLHVPAQYPTIQEAINNSSPGDTIQVVPGTYHENITVNTSSFLDEIEGEDEYYLFSNYYSLLSRMREPVRIVGSGAGSSVIDGDEAGPVITMGGSDLYCPVIIDGFSITGGDASKGGGIYIPEGPMLTVKDCNFSDSNAHRGGAIYMSSFHTIVENCAFTNNTADYGGAIYHSGLVSEIRNCDFYANSATHHGGAVCNDSPYFAIGSGCSYDSNTAGTGGNNIYNPECDPSQISMQHPCQYYQGILDQVIQAIYEWLEEETHQAINSALYAFSGYTIITAFWWYVDYCFDVLGFNPYDNSFCGQLVPCQSTSLGESGPSECDSGNCPPEKPVASSPTDSQRISLSNDKVILESSPFQDLDTDDNLTAAYWQILPRNEPLTGPVSDDYWDTNAIKKFSYRVPLPISRIMYVQRAIPRTDLDYGKYYYWRVKYRDSSGSQTSWSEWSDPAVFKAAEKTVIFVHGYHLPTDEVNPGVWAELISELTGLSSDYIEVIRGAIETQQDHDKSPIGSELFKGNGINAYVSNYTVIGPFTFQYQFNDVDIGGTQRKINEYAEQLSREIGKARINEGAGKIDIVAHSMGGLVARAYIESGDVGPDYFKGHVDKLIMIGTPNNGIEYIWDNVISHIVNSLCRDSGICQGVVEEAIDILPERTAPQQMLPTSDFIQDINHETGISGEDVGLSYYTIAGVWSGGIGDIITGVTSEFDMLIGVDDVKMDGVPLWKVESTHSGLTSNTEVLDMVENIVQQNWDQLRPPGKDPAAQQAPALQGKISTGEENTHQVVIGEASEAAFYLYSLASGLELTLITPGESIIEPSSVEEAPSVQYAQSDSEALKGEIFGIKNPEPGIWTVKVNAGDLQEEGAMYSVTTLLDTDTTIALELEKNHYAPDETMTIAAEMVDANSTIDNPSVVATIKRRGYPDESIELYDDGLHEDEESNDGMFANEYTLSGSPSSYDIAVTGSGSTDGYEFEVQDRARVWAQLYPDLSLNSSDISFSNENPASGESININAVVHNIGNAPVEDVKIDFFDGAPKYGHLIDQALVNVDSGSSTLASVQWDAIPGDHEIHVAISPFNAFIESNYDNNSATKSLHVSGPAITADAGGPYIGQEGRGITFDASGSSNPSGEPLQYSWDFDSDGSWDTGWSDNPQGTFGWGDDWSGKATVEVKSGSETRRGSGTVTIQNADPVIESTDDTTISAGETLDIAVPFYDPGWEDTHTAYIDWGDGVFERGVIGTDEGRPDMGGDELDTVEGSHFYGQPGEYNVHIMVSDDDGGHAISRFTVNVTEIQHNLSVSPEAISLTLPSGEVTDDTMLVSNSGTGSMEFNVKDISAFSVYDPSEGGPVDIDRLETMVGPEAMYFSIDTYTGWEDSMGIICLDADQNPATGAGSDVFPEMPGNIDGMDMCGSEYIIMVNLAAHRSVFLADWEGDDFEVLSKIPLSVDSDSIMITGPLCYIADDGMLDIKAMMSDSDTGATDMVPDEGYATYVETDAGWVSASPDSGIVQPGTPKSVNVNVDATNLSAGEYSALAIVSDIGIANESLSIPVDLTVIQPPVVASFSYSPENPVSGEDVTFDASDSYVTDGEIVSWEWDFGDGGSTSGEVVTHEYVQSGTFTVNLTVTDDDGGYGTASGTINVVSLGPEADFNWEPEPQSEGSPVQFTDASEPGGSEIIAWDWDFGGAGTSSARNPEFTFMDDGQYDVCLTVTDSAGLSGSKCQTVTITDMAPTAGFSWEPEPQDEGSPVQFTDTSTSPADEIVGWSWDFAGLGTSTEQNPGFTFIEDGSYGVSLAVEDDDGSVSSAGGTVTVTNVPPTVDAGTGQLAFEDEVVSLAPATFTDPGAEDTHTATIDWGDGAVDPGIIDQAAGTVSGSHVYSNPGVYTVTVTVADDDGGVGTDTFRAEVVHGFLRYAVFASGDTDVLTVHNNAAIHGGLAANGEVEVKNNGLVTGDLVSVSGGAILHNDSSVEGNVTTDADVELNNRAAVGGSVTSGGDVELKNKASVAGDVTAAGVVTLKNNATVGGTVTEGAAPPEIPAVTPVEVAVTAGGEDVTVDKNDTLTLPPGNYGKLTVKQNAALTLSSGTYAFDSIELAKNGTLNLDVSDGTILIDVPGDVEMKQNVQMAIVSASGDASDVLVRIGGGSVKLHNGGTYVGTFLAPYATIEVKNNVTLEGALYGDEVELKNGTDVTGSPAVELFGSLFLP